jgi:hypothetical protein
MQTQQIGSKTPWWDQAVKLWLAGYNDASIGKQVGVSRERIRQVKHAFPKRSWVSVGRTGEFAGTLMTWRQNGWIRRSPDGFWDLSEIEATRNRLLNRPCNYPGCSEPIHSVHPNTRYCEEHSIEVKRYAYPVRSPESKAKAKAASKKWKADHPEAARAMQARAGKAWRERQKALR